MHYNTILLGAIAALCTSATASSYNVTNYCDYTLWLTLSNNEQGVLDLNQELAIDTSLHYEIRGDHSLAVGNGTDYYSSNTAKLVLGTNSVNGILYYAIGQANSYPLQDHPFTYDSSSLACPNITTPDGSTKGCTDNGVQFLWTLCSPDI